MYAQQPGAVAAPTAGLHFTPELLDELVQNGLQLCFVTLHVGLGTFQPIRAEQVETHTMGTEWYEIDAATAGVHQRGQSLREKNHCRWDNPQHGRSNHQPNRRASSGPDRISPSCLSIPAMDFG